MAHTEAPLSPEALRQASSNYIHCLNLPKASQVLLIRDKSIKNPSDTLLMRSEFSRQIADQIRNDGHRVAAIDFDESESKEGFHRGVANILDELETMDWEGTGDHTTTIVYLGEAWTHRSGMYDAAENHGKKNKKIVRWAGSLGFSMGDARVMSELTPEKIDMIHSVNNQYEAFFRERAIGSFEIATRSSHGEEHVLHLSYNTYQSPFESDVGQFDDDHKTMISDHVHYVNIPGGEKFTSPFPFRETQGSFVAEGMLFAVSCGLVESVVELEEGAINRKDPRQKELIRLVSEGRKMPVSELGLGYYALAGITTYSDSSILSREKGGPHIGFAHPPATTSEAETLHALSGDFHHTDFVLDHPNLVWINPHNAERKLFYPPESLPKTK